LAWLGKAGRGAARQGTRFKNFLGGNMRAIDERLVELADQKALEFLMLKPGPEGFDNGQEAMAKQAVFGFRIKQEATKNARAMTDQLLRAARFLKPEDRERYVRESAPKLLPQLKKRP